MVGMERMEGKVRKSVSAIAIFVGALGLSGCGDAGYGGAVESCRQGDNTGVGATPGTRDINDPFVLLASGIGARLNVNDGRSRANPIFDLLDDGHGFGGNPGPRDTNTDYVDSMGELVCISTESEGSKPEEYNLVFTPAGLEVREYYSI